MVYFVPTVKVYFETSETFSFTNQLLSGLIELSEVKQEKKSVLLC